VSFFGGLFDSNEGELKRLRKLVERVNACEPAVAAMSMSVTTGLSWISTLVACPPGC